MTINFRKDFATAWMNYGIVLSALKKYEESEKSYLTALSQKPKCPDCYYNLGVLVKKLTPFYKLHNYYHKLNKVVRYLLLQYLEQKYYHKALTAWTNATKLKSTHRKAWTNMIILLDDLGM